MHRGFVTPSRFLAATALLFSISAVYGQQAAPEQEPVPEQSVGLAPGDTVDAVFLDFPEAGILHLTITSSGTIFVPYAGQVKVQGLMPEDAEKAIEEALRAKQIVKSPQVSLNVLTARNLSVLVLGAVTVPHPVPLFSP